MNAPWQLYIHDTDASLPSICLGCVVGVCGCPACLIFTPRWNLITCANNKSSRQCSVWWKKFGYSILILIILIIFLLYSYSILFLHWRSKGENLSRGLRIRTTSVQEMLKSMHASLVHSSSFTKGRLFMKDIRYVRRTTRWLWSLVDLGSGDTFWWKCSLFLFPRVFIRRRNNVPDKSLCERCALLYFWIINWTVSSSVWQAWPLPLHTISPGLNRANWPDWQCPGWRLSTSTSSTTESSTSFACVKENRLTTTPAQS